MNKKSAWLNILSLSCGIALIVGSSSCQRKQEKESADTLSIQETEVEEVVDTVPEGVKALMTAYPDFIVGFEDGNVVFSDGTTMIYDDGKEKGFEEMLDNSSLKDMFYTAYEVPESSPAYLNDAGRSRNEALFKKMYGSSPEAVTKKMVTVDWFGQRLQFTSVNGGAEQLKKVAAELAEYPELRKYLKSAGTYYWRNVRGANRLSAHSYGIAIDVGVDYSDYWLWKYAGAKEEQKIGYFNRMPRQLAEIFQKHGFIWGGAWYHFDTMHFEYRPEILVFAGLYNPQ